MPTLGAQVASVTFYNRTRTKAAAIIYRWDAEGDLEHTCPFRLLAPTPATYCIEDLDAGKVTDAASDIIISRGIPVPFAPNRRSAVVFVTRKGAEAP